MKEVGKGKVNSVRDKVISAIVVWLLVASILLVVVPLESPGTKAQPWYHSGGSAAWEDQDFGGGLDYNGDPAGDKKITWDVANNKTHIMDQTFVVNDDYILEIEPGVDLKLNTSIIIQIGSATGASFYCNGTPGSFVTISQNVSSSPWQGIYIVAGSYSYIEYTTITGGGLIYVEDSILDMSVSGISIMNSFGIYSTGSTTTVSGSVIMFTAQPGIQTSGCTFSLTNSFIADTMGTAVVCISTNATIDNNDLYGWNASAGSPGGQAIALTGTSSLVTISNNTIVGGRGGDNPGGGGGQGGTGISSSNYDGRVRIVDNDLIQGGRGGNNMLDGETAGAGGYAIYFDPVADYNSPPAIEIANNVDLLGGDGGDNLASMGGTAGNGDHAMRIIDSAGTGGDILISDNDNIIGGDGGTNDAAWGAGGWQAGSGGEGIRLENCQPPNSVTILLNPNIMGGRGGNTTDVGDLITLPAAGEGGNGVTLFGTNGVTMDQNVFTGGGGGDNTVAATSTRPGEGGIGVLLYSDNPPGSGADILSSTITGGDGGINLAPSQISGRGGNGLTSAGTWGSSGSAATCDITGGGGGGNNGVGGIGGDGGYGTSISGSTGWSISGGTIIGGRGGDNFDINGGGGNGNTSVLIAGTSDDITLTGVTNIVGGDGGIADTGDFGPGSGARTTIYTSGSTNLNILGSNIRVGKGGYNASSGLFGQNGEYCIYSDNLDGSNNIISNDITANNTSGIKYGIRLGLALTGDATISDNDIYENNIGIRVLNSNDVTIGSNNRIFDNYYGIYLDSSDAIIGPDNILTNNSYGFYSVSSNPTVESSSILNSDIWNVVCGSGSSPQLYNCTLIPKAGGGEILAAGDSHPWLLNTTFDKDETGFGDPASNITVNWYMHVRVVDTDYTPVPGATVWINDTFGKNIDSRVTDGQGWTRWVVVTEYVENLNEFKYYHTPHNVEVWESGRFGITQSNMTMSRVVIVMLDGVGFDIQLKQGWNMISIPMNQSSTLLTDVLAPISGLYNAAQWFDANDVSDPWKHYHINKGGLNDLSDIDREMGVWLYMKTDAIFPILGPVPVPSQTEIQLTEGWNFVGYPSFTKRTAGNETGEAFDSIASYLDVVQYYDASDPGNPWKAWDYGSYTQDDLLSVKPGFGLWIHVNADCTWSVDW